MNVEWMDGCRGQGAGDVVLTLPEPASIVRGRTLSRVATRLDPRDINLYSFKTLVRVVEQMFTQKMRNITRTGIASTFRSGTQIQRSPLAQMLRPMRRLCQKQWRKCRNMFQPPSWMLLAHCWEVPFHTMTSLFPSWSVATIRG